MLPADLNSLTGMYCLMSEKNNIIVTQFSLGQNLFSYRTQAFTSPTDMASSGVWENIILYKTPTFDGVCGMFPLQYKVGVLQRIIFSHTPEEAISVGLAKACVL